MDLSQFQSQKEILLKQQQEIAQQLADLSRQSAAEKQKALDDFKTAVKTFDISKQEIRHLLLEIGIEVHTYKSMGRKSKMKTVLPSAIDTVEILKRKDIADRWDRLLKAGNNTILMAEVRELGNGADEILRYVDSATETYILEHV